MNNNINPILQQVMQLKKKGMNPQQVMQMLFQRNPQYQQMLTWMKNSAQGRSPKEFVLQLAKQNGVDEQTLQSISEMMGQ